MLHEKNNNYACSSTYGLEARLEEVAARVDRVAEGSE